MPSSTARRAAADTVRTTSSSTPSIGSPPGVAGYSTRNGSVRGRAPPVCEQTMPEPRSAATSTSDGSCPAHVSLIRSAPASAAARATSARHVSTLTSRSGCRRRTRSTSGITRAISSAASTRGPRPARTPPRSTMSAPSSAARATASSAEASSYRAGA